MKEIDAARLKLKALEMVEGTDLHWWHVIKYQENPVSSHFSFDGKDEDYNLALGIVEGRPVFKGDKGWSENMECAVTVKNRNAVDGYWLYENSIGGYNGLDFTWEKPKP